MTVIVAAWSFYMLPAWLVVDERLDNASTAVVLGGGGGSRLRKGLDLYDAGVVDQLLLVDKSKRDWQHILENLCDECQISGKDVQILEGSINTFTDAELVRSYCIDHEINKLAIVTDPYHTRRASIIFKSQFDQSGVEIIIISSGFYGEGVPPSGRWWEDDETLKAILGEASKVFILYFRDSWISRVFEKFSKVKNTG